MAGMFRDLIYSKVGNQFGTRCSRYDSVYRSLMCVYTSCVNTYVNLTYHGLCTTGVGNSIMIWVGAVLWIRRRDSTA